MASPKGALISQVLEDSPAEKSGLQPMDVIIKFDERDIVYSADLPQTVGSIRPGEKVKAKIIRDSKEIELDIKVGKAPTNLAQVSNNVKEDEQDVLGIQVRSLMSKERQDLNIRFGLVVVKIDPTSSAAEAGIQENDVITYFNREKVTSIKQFETLIDKAKETKDTVMIGILRNGNQTFRSLKLTN